MKKILLIMPYGSVGGMERLALSFYNHYRSLGYQVKALKIIALESDIIHFGDDELALSHVDFSGMPSWKRTLFYFDAPRQIAKIVKKHGITHSIAFGDMANVFSSWSRTKEFKVASMHAVKSIEFQNKNFLNTVFKRAFRKSYRVFDKVVCISNAIKKDLVENCGYAFANLEVIYNPHDVPEIRRRSHEPLEAGEERIFASDTILFLGRLSIQKAPWHLVKAFILAAEKRPDLQLVMIGDGSREVIALVEKLKENHPNIHLLGRRSNPYKYMARAKAVALSSYYEGTPNVVVESIALDITGVSAFTPGIGEIMSVDARPEHNPARSVDTESGIVTPAFFKGTLTIPETGAFTPEEKQYADALLAIVGEDRFRTSLKANSAMLLEKFDLETVAAHYLHNAR